MPEFSLLLWDVGGVLLSDGWDRASRSGAISRFGLDPLEFERRHAEVEVAFETGRLDWEEYLEATVFYEPRAFSREEFRAYMREQSRPHPEAIGVARELRRSGKYRMSILNNESQPLNEYRLQTFHLNEIFEEFFSSCYTGLRKPDPAAFRLALSVTQHRAESTLFLDDRPENVEAAERLGMHALRVEDPARLARTLAQLGVTAG